MSSVLPGFEILHHQVSSSLTSKEDALVSVIHWILISDGMKCHGIGDEWPSHEDNVSELLPPNWNSNQEVYLLRYRNKSRLGSFLLKVIKVGPSILINLVNMEKEKAGGILVKTDDYVTDSFRDFKSAFKDVDKLVDSFKEEVMREVNKPTTAASTSDEKKCDKKVNKSKLENEDPLRVPGTERQPLTDWMTDRDPFGVGRGDLDPFGGVLVVEC
ncbi:proteasome inhibitor PI31 subunit-like [Tachypleus tridentatus]|uniref:proteasome inhibitor PI31 subunit-like n=1 Tax=Tachypleus tridentatus TaxID=6853 RepID=UPI003FD1E1B9